MDFEECKKEFDKFTSIFDMRDDKINRKYYHTYRVVDIAEKIAISEKLNENDVYLAKVCALLHDIARFKQAEEYNTFNDNNSFDHGNVGVEILKNNDYISKYLINDDDKKICLRAVKNHNKYQIDNDLTEREKFFSQMLRDSDKVDIISSQVMKIKDQEGEIYLPIINSIRNQKLYKINFKNKIPNDISKIAIQLCFVFDLNFKKSIELLVERDVIKDKINMIKIHGQQEIANEIEFIIKSYISKKI